VFKGLSNLGNLMRNAQQLGGRLQELNAELRAKRVTGSSGGGMVQVETNGLGDVLSLTIDPQLIERQERDMIEDLVPAAVNQAIRKSRELHAASIRSLADGLGLPGLDEIVAKFTDHGS
jgi:DNA-binding YbaB/EbfC family protein